MLEERIKLTKKVVLKDLVDFSKTQRKEDLDVEQCIELLVTSYAEPVQEGLLSYTTLDNMQKRKLKDLKMDKVENDKFRAVNIKCNNVKDVNNRHISNSVTVKHENSDLDIKLVKRDLDLLNDFKVLYYDYLVEKGLEPNFNTIGVRLKKQYARLSGGELIESDFSFRRADLAIKIDKNSDKTIKMGYIVLLIELNRLLGTLEDAYGNYVNQIYLIKEIEHYKKHGRFMDRSEEVYVECVNTKDYNVTGLKNNVETPSFNRYNKRYKENDVLVTINFWVRLDTFAKHSNVDVKLKHILNKLKRDLTIYNVTIEKEFYNTGLLTLKLHVSGDKIDELVETLTSFLMVNIILEHDILYRCKVNKEKLVSNTMLMQASITTHNKNGVRTGIYVKNIVS